MLPRGAETDTALGALGVFGGHSLKSKSKAAILDGRKRHREAHLDHREENRRGAENAEVTQRDVRGCSILCAVSASSAPLR